MGKIFVVVGLVFLAGGSYAIIDGWPYLVLERGFTQVILGAIAATLGVVLLAVAAVLAELGRLKLALAGASAFSPPHAAAPMPLDARMHPSLGAGGAVAAAAGAAAVGGALLASTGKGEAGEHPSEDELAPEAEPHPDLFDSVSDPEPPAAVEPTVPVGDSDLDEWLKPAPALEVPPLAVESKLSEPSAAADDAQALSPAEELFDTSDAPPAEREEPSVAPVATISEKSAEADDLPATPEPEEPAREAPWWPRIEPRDAAPELDGDKETSDEFGALRDELSGALAATPLTAERDDTRSGFDDVGSWMEPRPWPPVTHPVPDSELLADDDSAGRAEQAQDKEIAVPLAQPAAEIAADDVDIVEPAEPAASEEAEEPVAIPESEIAADEPPDSQAARAAAAEEQPAASEEGVIGAYQVGEAHFTMYADGSIQAKTPDGDYVFASMEELKAYLASEKSKIEPDLD